MPSALFGLGCLLVFAVVRAVQDTFFGNVFQSISFFIVASLAFGLSTAVFGAWAWHHNSKEVRALINQTRLFIALNATTAVAWIMYFFALKNIEPAIVNTLYTGIGPIAVLVLAQLRISMAHRTDTSWTELLEVISASSRHLLLSLASRCLISRDLLDRQSVFALLL